MIAVIHSPLTPVTHIMAEYGHDRLNPSATFGELGADGVAEPMRGHGGTALAIDQPGLAAGDRQRFFE